MLQIEFWIYLNFCHKLCKLYIYLSIQNPKPFIETKSGKAKASRILLMAF